MNKTEAMKWLAENIEWDITNSGSIVETKHAVSRKLDTLQETDREMVQDVLKEQSYTGYSASLVGDAYYPANPVSKGFEDHEPNELAAAILQSDNFAATIKRKAAIALEDSQPQHNPDRQRHAQNKLDYLSKFAVLKILSAELNWKSQRVQIIQQKTSDTSASGEDVTRFVLTSDDKEVPLMGSELVDIIKEKSASLGFNYLQNVTDDQISKIIRDVMSVSMPRESTKADHTYCFTADNELALCIRAAQDCKEEKAHVHFERENERGAVGREMGEYVAAVRASRNSNSGKIER